MKFNLSNILGIMAFLSMLIVPGAVESEKYILAIVLIITSYFEADISMRENEKSTHDR